MIKNVAILLPARKNSNDEEGELRPVVIVWKVAILLPARKNSNAVE